MWNAEAGHDTSLKHNHNNYYYYNGHDKSDDDNIHYFYYYHLYDIFRYNNSIVIILALIIVIQHPCQCWWPQAGCVEISVDVSTVSTNRISQYVEHYTAGIYRLWWHMNYGGWTFHRHSHLPTLCSHHFNSSELDFYCDNIQAAFDIGVTGGHRSGSYINQCSHSLSSCTGERSLFHSFHIHLIQIYCWTEISNINVALFQWIDIICGYFSSRFRSAITITINIYQQQNVKSGHSSLRRQQW